MTPTRVLVVEDEGLIANDIADRLRKDGYHVTGIAASSEEVFRHLDKTTPDLVLMDIRIKGNLDGIETAERVRANFDVPIIFLTAHADRDTLERAKVTEPFGYLVKPFRQINLAGSIEMALYKHRSEQQLKQREAWLATVLLSSPNPTIVTDRMGTIRFLNPLAEELIAMSRDQLIGQTFTAAFPLFDIRTGSPSCDLVAAALRKNCIVTLPRGLALRRTALSDIEIDGEIAPSLENNSHPGSIITLRDATQRSREEQEVCHEQKMLAVGRMAGGVAHDFNNLLTVILGYSEQLLSGPLNEQQRSAIQAVSIASQNAAGITSQLLALSSRKVEPKEVVRPNEIVARVVNLLRSTVGSKVELLAELNSQTGSIRANPSQMDQVLVNLILNARDAMLEGGRITVSTSNFEREVETLLTGFNMAQYVRITVTDSANGIVPEALTHVFEPFYVSRPLRKGTGLALATIYSIVKQAEGELNVFSNVGAGSTFEILLPRVPDRISPEPLDQPGPTTSTLATILLVEDEPMLRAMTHNYFEQKGYNLLEAADGEEALKIADLYQWPIDVLVTDVEMPKLDGPMLAAAFANDRPETKVLLVSGYSLSGSGEFLQKPFTLATLHRKIEDMLIITATIH